MRFNLPKLTLRRDLSSLNNLSRPLDITIEPLLVPVSLPYLVLYALCQYTTHFAVSLRTPFCLPTPFSSTRPILFSPSVHSAQHLSAALSSTYPSFLVETCLSSRSPLLFNAALTAGACIMKSVAPSISPLQLGKFL